MGAYSSEGYKSPLLSTKPGFHRITWDLLMEGAETIKNARVDMGSPKVGPMVLPGEYSITLKVNGTTSTSSLTVRMDPRVELASANKHTATPAKQSLTLAELEEQVAFASQIRDDITSLTRTVEALKSVRKQLKDRTDLLKEDVGAAKLVKAAKALIQKLDDLEAKFHNPSAEVSYDILAKKGGAKLYSQMIWLYINQMDADGAPTQGSREVYQDHKKVLNALQAEWNEILKTELKKVNQLAQEGQYPIVIVPAVKKAE